MKLKILTVLLPLACILSGCASDSKKIVDLQLSYIPTSAVPTPTNSNHTQQQVMQASRSIDQSMNTLAQMKMAQSPVGRFQPPSNAKATRMNKHMTISWNGPMLAAVNKIATATHYQVRTVGNVPATPLLINLQSYNQPIANILRDIQYQVFHHAKIVVYPATNYIEIRYVS